MAEPVRPEVLTDPRIRSARLGAVAPLEVHDAVRVDRPDRDAVDAEIVDVEQRNWSRTAHARTFDGDTLFVKQFYGRDGVIRTTLLDDEQHGLRVAAQCFGDELQIPRLYGRNLDIAMLCYERIDLIPIDVALRADSTALERQWPAVCDEIRRLVERVQSSALEPATERLTVKERCYETRAMTVNFKGLEMRNLAVQQWLEPARSGRPRLLGFDFGRPYVAPVEELAARLLASTLLLNWGHPASRFVQGPPLQLADELAEHLGLFLSADAVSEGLEREARARRTVSRFGSRGAQVRKRSALATVGSWYLRRARRWCRARELA